jgi:WD40 repeat protein
MRATTLQKAGPGTENGHEEGLWAVAWLPGHTQLLTGSVDETAKLWSAEDDALKCTHTYTGQALGVVSLDVDPSGRYAVSSSLDSTVRVFGLDDDKGVKHLIERQPTETWGTAFGTVTPDSQQIAVAGGSKGQAFVYKGTGEEPVQQLALDLPQVSSSVCSYCCCCPASSGSGCRSSGGRSCYAGCLIWATTVCCSSLCSGSYSAHTVVWQERGVAWYCTRG